MAKERYKAEKNDDLSQLMYGRVMPQATELEEAVLGAAMLDKGRALVHLAASRILGSNDRARFN